VSGISLTEGIDSGPLWDPEELAWHSGYTQLPVANGGKLLLVPKVIVRRKMDYDADEYYRNYILAYLAEMEMAANTELVQLLKNGDRRVTKKDLIAKYGKGKSVIVRETRLHPEILEQQG
jgi:hypothetical protein